LAHGNIYPPEQVDAALANYFRPGNLGALRAGLAVVPTIEESLRRTWPTTASPASGRRERVVVGISAPLTGSA
jgi:two-component system sensor histidine kinase KdpD